MDQRAVDIGLNENEWRTICFLCQRFAQEDLSQLFSRADLEQEALAELYKAFHSYEQSGRPITNRRFFVYLVVKRRFVKLISSTKSPPLGSQEYETMNGDDKVERMLSDIDYQTLVRGVLKDKEWKLIERLYWGENGSQTKVAKELGIAESTVSSRKWRAIGRMREYYDAESERSGEEETI